MAHIGSLEREYEPRLMRYTAVRARRKSLIWEPHVEQLNQYVDKLRAYTRMEVPYVDPLLGGVEASLLFVFQDPGPMTAATKGSGFLSLNNDDRTAEFTNNSLRSMKIPWKEILFWNAVPWHGSNLTAPEIKRGTQTLRELIHLLAELQAVVLVGNVAKQAGKYLAHDGFARYEKGGENILLGHRNQPKIFSSYHPSRKSAVQRTRIERVWAQAWHHVRLLQEFDPSV